MMKNITMRHEEKFLCTNKQLYLIESRIKTLMDLDQGQQYNIRSMYFDTDSDRLYDESVQGIRKRDKYRIRIYNGSNENIKLEKKTTIGQLKEKKVCRLSSDVLNSIISNKEWFQSDMYDRPNLVEFNILQKTENLVPKVIVEYERKAYIYDIGNVRVTFDYNVRASVEIESFFEKKLLTYPILPPYINILEVKYDGILPGVISELVNIGSLQRTSVSKYVMSRDILFNDGRNEKYEF